MLNSKLLEKTYALFDAPVGVAWGNKDQRDVKTPKPKLRPVVSIRGPGQEAFNVTLANVFSLPDGRLVRLRYKGDWSYDYEDARVFSKENPAYIAALCDPLRIEDGCVEIERSQEGKLGPRANEADIKYLKNILEPQIREDFERLKAEGYFL